MNTTTVLLLLAVAALALPGSTTDREHAVASDLLNETMRALAPDRRTSVCDLKGELRGNELTLRGEVYGLELRDQVLRYIRERRGYIIIDSLTVLPSPALEGMVFGLASQSVISMRSKPDHAAELVNQATLGTPLKVLKKGDGFHFVQTPDEYLGWVDDGLVLMNAGQYQAWLDRRKVIVTAEFGFVRQTADPRSQVVSDIVVCDIFALRADAGAHYEVEYPDGRIGFLPKDLAEPLDAWLGRIRDTPETIVATAKRFFGIPYFWGGTSAKALDCSGFTKTVYFLNGVLLPRDASQQALVGKPVEVGKEFAGLQAGDLLFFGTKATPERKERATHVGIALGGGKFIHEGGDVRINSLDERDPEYSAPRAHTFLGARRVVGIGEEYGVRRLSQIAYYRGHEHQ